MIADNREDVGKKSVGYWMSGGGRENVGKVIIGRSALKELSPLQSAELQAIGRANLITRPIPERDFRYRGSCWENPDPVRSRVASPMFN